MFSHGTTWINSLGSFVPLMMQRKKPAKKQQKNLEHTRPLRAQKVPFWALHQFAPSLPERDFSVCESAVELNGVMHWWEPLETPVERLDDGIVVLSS